MLGKRFTHSGDSEARITSWLKEHLRAIATCLNGGFPEAGLVLIYSGIDTLGLLAAAPEIDDATGETVSRVVQKVLSGTAAES